jgi:hypothetical protein
VNGGIHTALEVDPNQQADRISDNEEKDTYRKLSGEKYHEVSSASPLKHAHHSIGVIFTTFDMLRISLYRLFISEVHMLTTVSNQRESS